ncbi:MAG: galactokinase, partial [Clostridiales bacterium]|nr:galactokinase [Clostridiales bacterium]
MLTIGFSKKQLQNGAYDEVLARLTCKKDITAARGRVMDLLLQYQETFKAGEDSRIAVLSAPGRTEIGGNHTDHQRGHVLAAAINLDQLACAAPNGTSLIRLHSKGYEPLSIDISTLSPVESEKYTTSALIRGIAARISEMGYKLHGFDACVVSDVASGSGLSSSAAFEVLAGLIINHLYCSDLLSPEELARIGQYSENVYFGKPCGLM